MLAPSPSYLNRKKLTTALRSGEHVQIKQEIGNWRAPRSPVCFMGLAYRICPPPSIPASYEDYNKWWQDTYDINPALRSEMHQLNDEGWTFPQLADKLETKF